MQSETVIIAIIATVISPIIVKFLEYGFSVISKSKQRAEDKVESQTKHIAILEQRLDEEQDKYTKSLEVLRASIEKDYNARIERLTTESRAAIEGLRNENIKLQILVAETNVKLTLKDETIARLLNERELLRPKTAKK